MQADYVEAVGLALGIGGYLPYVISIVRGMTKPSLVSWAIWTVQGAALLATYIGLGQWEGIAVPVVTTIGPAIVMTLAWQRSRLTFTRIDIASIAGTLAAGVLWALSGNARWSLYCLVATDVCGAIPTVAKTAKDPTSEDLVSWIVFLAGNVLVGVSISEQTVNSLLYPSYLITLCATIVLLSLRRFHVSDHR